PRLPDVSRQNTRKGVGDGRDGKPKPYQVGVQIPCGVYPQVPEEDLARRTATALGRGVPQAGGAEGESNRRGASAARPRAHDDRDSAQVCGVASDWVYQREECGPPGTGVWREEEELRGPALLGARVLRIDRGAG